MGTHTDIQAYGKRGIPYTECRMQFKSKIKATNGGGDMNEREVAAFFKAR